MLQCYSNSQAKSDTCMGYLWQIKWALYFTFFISCILCNDTPIPHIVSLCCFATRRHRPLRMISNVKGCQQFSSCEFCHFVFSTRSRHLLSFYFMPNSLFSHCGNFYEWIVSLYVIPTSFIFLYSDDRWSRTVHSGKLKEKKNWMFTYENSLWILSQRRHLYNFYYTLLDCLWSDRLGIIKGWNDIINFSSQHCSKVFSKRL